MYRSILVPLDGTGFGEHALPVARGIARRLGATLHLVHVHTGAAVPTDVEALPYFAPPDIDAPAEERAYLQAVAEQVAADGVRVVTELVQGALTESLEHYAVGCGADLVVACTHAHEGLSRFWHRGVAEQILCDVSIPVVLIHADQTRPELRSEYHIRHVLIPLNGSAFAEEVLDVAIPLGRVLGARFTLLRVVRPMAVTGYTLLGQDTHVNEFLLEEHEREAQTYLDQMAERLRAAGLEVGTIVSAAEDPASAIVAATRPGAEPGQPPVDLIAMTTHGRSPLARVVVSSVTDDVLHQTPVPMLLHHPLGLATESRPMHSRAQAAAGELMQRQA